MIDGIEAPDPRESALQALGAALRDAKCPIGCAPTTAVEQLLRVPLLKRTIPDTGLIIQDDELLTVLRSLKVDTELLRNDKDFVVPRRAYRELYNVIQEAQQYSFLHDEKYVAHARAVLASGLDRALASWGRGEAMDDPNQARLVVRSDGERTSIEVLPTVRLTMEDAIDIKEWLRKKVIPPEVAIRDGGGWTFEVEMPMGELLMRAVHHKESAVNRFFKDAQRAVADFGINDTRSGWTADELQKALDEQRGNGGVEGNPEPTRVMRPKR